ncbi:hypothetical protein [Persicitalea sp.]|uniref:hypothetical protein n=1 Tax=Persicitalea sp. TaxID=3100273 RepID=UPI003593D886
MVVKQNYRFFFLSIPLYLLGTGLAWTQDTTSLNNKWEIGIDLLQFLDKDKNLNPTILIRRQINQNSAIRLRGSVDFFSRASDGYTNYHYSIRPAYEKVNFLTPKSSLHYGIELRYDREKLKLYLVDTHNLSKISIQDFLTFKRTLGTGVFIGYRYFILNNFSFYIETGLNYENPKYRMNSINGLIAVNGIEVTGGVEITDFEYVKSHRIFLTPLKMLNISFHF